MCKCILIIVLVKLEVSFLLEDNAVFKNPFNSILITRAHERHKDKGTHMHNNFISYAPGETYSPVLNQVLLVANQILSTN